MKKLLLLAALTLGCVSANAAYLYWQVGSTVQTDAGGTWGDGADGYDTARVFITGQSTAISEYATPMPTAMSVDLSSISGDYASYSYYVELSAYNGGTYEWRGTSQTFTYQQLVNAGAVTTSLSEIPKLSAWNGGTSYHVSPEPTSGMLLLVGMALMALKRRRA